MHSRRNLEKSYIGLVRLLALKNIFMWLTIVCVEPKTVLHGTKEYKQINVMNWEQFCVFMSSYSL